MLNIFLNEFIGIYIRIYAYWLIDRSGVNRERSRSTENDSPDILPPVRFCCTYRTENGIEAHGVLCTWPEEAVLMIGRGIPIKVEFADKADTDGRYVPIAKHVYADFKAFPEIVAQQTAIDTLRLASC